MTTSFSPGVLLPFVLAALPAALPAGVPARRLVSCTVACAAATLLLAAWCALPSVPAWLVASGGIWRNDALARTMAILPAITWLLVTVRASQAGEAMRSGAGRLRRWPVSGQLATAFAMALCRAELLALLPLLFAGLLLCAYRDHPTGRGRALLLASLPVMASGVSVLSTAIGVPARWGSLLPVSTSGRMQIVGLVLLLTPMLMLSVFATLRPAMEGRAGVLRGFARMMVIVPVLLLSLRCEAAGRLEPVLWCFGVGAILLSLVLLPSCRGLQARLALAVSLQHGVSLVAVASGGPGAVAAAVMLLGFLSLLLPLALWFPLDTASARLRTVAIAAMLGMPPFGPFAAASVLLVRLSATMPAPAVALLLAAALTAVSVLHAAARALPPVPGARVTAWFSCAAIALLVSLWLGLAMPAALSDWLLAIAAVRS